MKMYIDLNTIHEYMYANHDNYVKLNVILFFCELFKNVLSPVISCLVIKNLQSGVNCSKLL